MMNKSLFGVAIGAGIGAGIGLVVSNLWIFIVALCLGAGVGFAVGGWLAQRDKEDG